MAQNIIKLLLHSTYKISKIRLRQFYTVATVLLMFGMFNISRIEANQTTQLNSISKSETEHQPEICITEESASSPQNFSTPISGVTQEMSHILKDSIEYTNINTSVSTDAVIAEIPERENTLYYVVDEPYTFYCNVEYQDYLWKKLKEYDHTDLYETCLAMMYHESKFEKDTISASNDHGLMQINGGNLKWLKTTLNITSLDDPYDNIDCGVYILVTNLEKYGSIEEALVAYNQGYCGEIKSTSYSQCILGHDLNCLRVLEEEEKGEL